MKISEMLSADCVCVDLKALKKEEALSELCELLSKNKKLQDSKSTVKILMERESLGSTGIGQGVAIPHGKTKNIKSQVSALGISRKGLDFTSLDGEPVYIIFLLVGPVDDPPGHIKALSKISKLLKNKFIRQAFRDSKSTEEVLKIIREEDEY